MSDRMKSNRQMIYHGNGGVARLGIYVDSRSGNLFHGSVQGECHADNRINPDKVWIDDDGYICVDVDRRTYQVKRGSDEK